MQSTWGEQGLEEMALKAAVLPYWKSSVFQLFLDTKLLFHTYLMTFGTRQSQAPRPVPESKQKAAASHSTSRTWCIDLPSRM